MSAQMSAYTLIAGAVLFARVVTGLPQYYGADLSEDFKFLKGTGEVKCGVIPEVGQKLGPHAKVVEEEVDKEEIFFFDDAGNEKQTNFCYIPGQEHIVHLHFPDARRGLVYIEGGKWSSLQEMVEVNPSSCKDTRRTFGIEEETKHESLTYVADDQAEGLEVKLVTASGSTAPQKVLTFTLEACDPKNQYAPASDVKSHEGHDHGDEEDVSNDDHDDHDDHDHDDHAENELKKETLKEDGHEGHDHDSHDDHDHDSHDTENVKENGADAADKTASSADSPNGTVTAVCTSALAAASSLVVLAALLAT